MSEIHPAAWDMLAQAPKMYGPLHLAVLLAGIPLAAAAAWRLRRHTGRALMWGMWAVFVAAEIYKQLYLWINEPVYPLWYLPFQLCSMPLYLCPPAAAARPGRVKSALCTFLCGGCTLGGLAALAFPEDILRHSASLLAHGLIWHLLLIFLGCWLGFSGYGQSGRLSRRLLGAAGVLLGCAGVALTLNLLLWQPSGHAIQLFYLGPMPSTQPVFSLIAARIGWLGCAPVYLACLALGISGLYLLLQAIGRRAGRFPREKRRG